ncbi:hypothetical protein ANN_01441 [Periplaneta americana]|uniref:Pickpocket n=1 Tax=Periplaneta americana TaxID=6978 RepID=A0ABQ8TWY7_PERAM|nr:hypothetical protein ANN_01441 [Periplaneta americana]
MYIGWTKSYGNTAVSDDGAFESCQLCGHEQGLLDELVQPATTVLCQSTAGLREACADAALPYRTVARWVKAFREGRDAVQDNLRTGRPRVEDNTVQLLASLLDADRRWTARELAAEVRSHRPCWTGTKGKMTTFLDESLLWTKPGLAHINQPNLKRQSNEWKHPGSSRPKKVRPTQSAVKVMFIVEYDIDGVILHHAVPPRQTANADYYCRFLQHHLRPALRRKRRHLVVQNPNILHDNARSHTAAAVKDLLRRWQWEILEHPPYSPDMSPCDYNLFTKVKEPLRGTRYNTRDELIRAIGRSIRNINKDGRANGIRRLPNIWQKEESVPEVGSSSSTRLSSPEEQEPSNQNEYEPSPLKLSRPSVLQNIDDNILENIYEDYYYRGFNSYSKLMWRYECIRSKSNCHKDRTLLDESFPNKDVGQEKKSLPSGKRVVVIKCEAFISKCTFKAEPFDCCNALKPLLTEVGYCLAFNSKFAGGGIQPRSEGEFKLEYVHETDHKWSLTMEVDNGNEVLGTLNPVRVYIHSTEDYPVIDVPPQHVWDQKIQKISFNPKQTYTTEGARQLTIKQRKCVYEDEIRLVTSDIYTYRSCMIQCRMALARKLCKCVPFLYKKLDGFKYCDLNGMQCLGKNEDKLKAASCPCELGCSNTVYEVEKLVGDNNQNSLKELEVGFVSWPMVRYKREVLFGWVDLLVSFGGIAGLFLGFSLLSGVEIIYYFTMRALCMVYRNKEDLQRLQEEYKKAEKPPLDLRLTPTFMRKNRENAVRNTNPSSITTVKPGINFISATPMQNFPTTTLTQRVNKPGFHKPIYSKFEFLD